MTPHENQKWDTWVKKKNFVRDFPNFYSWQHDKRRSFAAYPINTARRRENQRRKTRYVGAPKRAFRARLPPIFLLGSFKIDGFLRIFLSIWKSMFRARLPSIFNAWQKMRCLPGNLHLVATWRSPANAICKNTQQDTFKVLRLPRKMTMDTSKVLRLPRKMTMDTSKVLRLPRKLQHIFWKRPKSICASHTKRLSTRSRTRLSVTKRHACDAKRRNDTSEASKKDPSCRTSHRHGHMEFVRTVADGCGRLRTVRQRRANTPSTPRAPKWNGNPSYAFGKNPCSTGESGGKISRLGKLSFFFGCQSKAIDGLKSFLSFVAFSVFLWISACLRTYLSIIIYRLLLLLLSHLTMFRCFLIYVNTCLPSSIYIFWFIY